MDVYKLYGSATASTDALASLDIQRDGHIVAFALSLSANGADALGDGGQAEVSFASTSGFASNDTKASFAFVRVRQAFLTSGGSEVTGQHIMGGLAIAVAAGERVYLHFGLLSAPTSVEMTAYLYVMPLPETTRASARRAA